MSNPFAKVIDDLRWIINISDAATFAENEEIEQAIRLLEAAGVIGRKRLEELVDITRQQDDTALEYLFRAILPDPDKS